MAFFNEPHQEDTHATVGLSPEFLSLLPENSKKIDWAKSVMLRYQWIQDHSQGEDVAPLLFREIILTITGDDAHCIHSASESNFSPEIWRHRLLARLDWEIRELLELDPNNQDIVDLLQKAQQSIESQNWDTQLPEYQSSVWKEVRDSIMHIEKVDQAIEDSPELLEQRKRFFGSWGDWLKKEEYTITT